MNSATENGHVAASNLTIDGGGIGTGIEVSPNASPSITSGTASAIVKGAILRNLPRAIYRYGFTAPEIGEASTSPTPPTTARR